jgi:8-oxo-dGTP diphosphatase
MPSRGFVEWRRGTEAAVRREAKEETGLEIDLLGLVGVYSDPARDPRGHVVSICYLARGRGTLASGSDARSAEVFPIDKLPPLAFDHEKMIRDAIRLSDLCNDQLNDQLKV